MMNKTKILIVDDRKENLIALETILRDLDITIIKARSGNEALQQMLSNEFALVLMDVQMPEMDGFEAVQLMHNDKNLALTPVIFISAIYKEEAYNIKGIESGAVDFIIKPIVPEILIGKVKIFIKLFEDRKHLEQLNESIKENEDLLIQSQKTLINAQKIAKIGNFTYNIKTGKIQWSKEIFKIFNIPFGTPISLDSLTVLIHSEDKSLFLNTFQNSDINQNPNFVEYRIICPDGSLKWLRSQNEIQYDNRELCIIHGTIQDITISKIAEQKLEWELFINKTLAKLSNNLIKPNLKINDVADYVFNASKKITNSKHGYVSEINKITKENVCYTLSNMIEDECDIDNPSKQISFACNDNGTYPTLWGHSINSGEPFITNSFQKESSATSIPFGHIPIKNFLSIPVKYNNEVIGQISLANSNENYTDKHIDAIQRIAMLYALAIHRIRDEEEKLKMQKELQQAEKMQVIGQLAGGIAHDFNNQLATIMGNAELALDEIPESSPINRNIRNIIVVSKRAADLTNQLLAYARKGNYIKESIDLNKVILEVISLLERTIDKKITLKKDLHAAGLQIEGDPTQIYSAILNIGINARDAIDDNGSISFTTKEIILTEANLTSFNKNEQIIPGRYISVEISDTGKGIEKEILDKIFDPFFTTKELGKGTGMGLSAVLGIVKMHNGLISVDSTTDKGTTFKLLFPLKMNSQIGKRNTPNKYTDNVFSGSILLVDDEEMILDLGKVMLSKIGFEVYTASNGKEAIEIYRNNADKIKLVILDMIMPKMDGKEALTKIIKLNPKAKVLITTGYTGDHEPIDIKSLGAVDIIKKPFDFAKLASIIESII